MKAASGIPFPGTSEGDNGIDSEQNIFVPTNKKASTFNSSSNGNYPHSALPSSEQHRRSTRRQLHLWIPEKDFLFLHCLAGEEEEPVAKIVRRLIRQFRQTSAAKNNRYP
ncbi:MAG TPA: hypothetical protein VKZ53_30585 [Candidatus Angelobacter sp.]|nr:hypothetical protein [Candidatus Angelobacter sp.]